MPNLTGIFKPSSTPCDTGRGHTGRGSQLQDPGHGSMLAALVVDDDPAWQEILTEVLADSGLTVDVAASPAAALAALRARPHRIAVVDLSLVGGGLPDQEGLQILGAVKRLDPDCVTVLLTGFATVELAVSALTNYGAMTCLQKETFRRSEFRTVLRRVLALPPPADAEPTAEAAPAAAATSRGPAGDAGERTAGEHVVASRGAVLLVEDDAGWRSVLGQLLAEAGFRVRACPSYGEALGYLRRESYALAVVDLALASSLAPNTNRDGWQLLAWARAASIPAIVVSGSAAAIDVERAYAEHGIYAYLEKQAFDRRAFLALAGEAASHNPEVGEELQGLTRRERDVLSLLAQGLTNKDIASALVVSPNTVKRYLKSIFEKLGVDTRAAAAAKAIRGGLNAQRDR
jgi:DNA-binding NarL/FixJ family response regulator